MEVFDPFIDGPAAKEKTTSTFIGKGNYPGICFKVDKECHVYCLISLEKNDFVFYGKIIPELAVSFPKTDNFKDNELYFVRIIELENKEYVLAPIMAWRGFQSGSFSLAQLQEIAVRAFQEYAAACGPIREARIF